MAKHKLANLPKSLKTDLTSWNFILFLTLALMLLVAVMVTMQKVTFDLRSRAFNSCPTPELPKTQCVGGEWKYKADTNGCYTFFCEVK